MVPLAADCASAGIAVKLAANTKRRDSNARRGFPLRIIRFLLVEEALVTKTTGVRDVRVIIHPEPILSRGLCVLRYSCTDAGVSRCRRRRRKSCSMRLVARRTACG